VEKLTLSAEKNDNILQKILDKLSKMEDRLSFLCVRAHVAAMKRRCSFAGSVQEKQNTLQGNLCFFLHDQGEDMQKWDGKPTADLETWVRELIKKISKRKVILVSGQFSRQGRWNSCPSLPDLNKQQ